MEDNAIKSRFIAIEPRRYEENLSKPVYISRVGYHIVKHSTV